MVGQQLPTLASLAHLSEARVSRGCSVQPSTSIYHSLRPVPYLAPRLDVPARRARFPDAALARPVCRLFCWATDSCLVRSPVGFLANLTTPFQFHRLRTPKLDDGTCRHVDPDAHEARAIAAGPHALTVGGRHASRVDALFQSRTRSLLPARAQVVASAGQEVARNVSPHGAASHGCL